MESISKTSSCHTDDNSHLQVQELETRYIELLEMRVAVLEALVNEEGNNSGKDSGCSDRDVRAGNLNANDEIQKLANQKDYAKTEEDSNASNAEKSPNCRIRFRDVKYTKDGIEFFDVSATESTKVDQIAKSEDSDLTLVWTRRFGIDNKYRYSEVEIVSSELKDLFRVVLAHDSRLHFSNNRNDVTFTTPFLPLIHNWQFLEKLEKFDDNEGEWKEIKRKMRKLNSAGVKAAKTNIDQRVRKAKEDLEALLNQVRCTPEMGACLSALEIAKTGKTIQFDHLWTLFAPGDLVYATPFMKQEQVFIVKDSSHHIKEEGGSNSGRDGKRVWPLYCWSYDWNGKEFDRISVIFKIQDFQGSRMVNTLPCHPLSYHFSGHDTDSKLAEFYKSLISRGRKFEDYCTKAVGTQMFEYAGEAICHGSGFQRLKNKQNQEIRGGNFDLLYGYKRRGNPSPKASELRRFASDQVMVDFDSYIQHGPNIGVNAPMGDVVFSYSDDECRCSICMANGPLRENQRRHYDAWIPAKNKTFSDEQFLICPPRVLGYHLATRTWSEFFVENVQPIMQTISDDQFTRLQLSPMYKNLIRKLIQSHTSGSERKPLMQDIVKGKGKGLVILLHGPPGVGKTLTAESVAAMAGKPLFSVSPSDIGLDPADVEYNLESLFELAARWRAVLLVDEADVFLESRSSHNSDLTRNALVSVLLRVLEYYSGILILTTNRINHFDIAVQSRVNLGIKYNDLTQDQKHKIFKAFIDGVHEDQIEEKQEILNWFVKDTDALEYFEPLNGRQVRNVLFSAASLGQNDGGTLKLEHIKDIAKSTFKFQESLKVVVQASRAKNEAGRYGD